MLVRDIKRLLLVVTPIVTLLCVSIRLYYGRPPTFSSHVTDWLEEHAVAVFSSDIYPWQQTPSRPQHHESRPDEILDDPSKVTYDSSSDKDRVDSHDRVDGSAALPPEPQLPPPPPPPPLLDDVSLTHQQLFSLASPDRKYFSVLFNTFDPNQEVMNPNIIPHPSLPDTWIVVAQRQRTSTSGVHFAELVCNAAFSPDGSALACITPPIELPIAPTTGDQCTGDFAYFGLNIGPHDARVFHGLDAPYVIYGSNGRFTCFGMWVQDLRALLPDVRQPTAAPSFLGLSLGGGKVDEIDPSVPFHAGTELARPPPYSTMEKNWFLFWDTAGTAYVHHDVAPRRVFTQLGTDGSAGPDLGPIAAAAGDDACMARLMPHVAPDLESVHQATNSLSITLCRRADPACVETDDNTFVVTLFHHKSFYHFHGQYEPYAMLFRRTAPFALYAVSTKPLWINGRARYDDYRGSEMVYVVSMGWKDRGLTWHGFLDDVVFLAFGIEDKRAAGIDVLAEDLLAGLGLCAES